MSLGIRLTEEDGIITADQARGRSNSHTDDSIIREPLREIMALVKDKSTWGLRSTTKTIFGENHPLPVETINILEQLGYTVETLPGYGEKYNYRISW